MTHNELNVIAAKWCKRPASGNGPGRQVALTEVGGHTVVSAQMSLRTGGGLTAVRWWWSPRSAALIFWLTGQNPTAAAPRRAWALTGITSARKG